MDVKISRCWWSTAKIFHTRSIKNSRDSLRNFQCRSDAEKPRTGVGDKRERGNGEKSCFLGFGFTLMDDCGFETLSWMHTNFYHSFISSPFRSKPTSFSRRRALSTFERGDDRSKNRWEKTRPSLFSLPFHSSIRSGVKSKWSVQLPTLSKLKMDAVLSFDYENRNDVIFFMFNEIQWTMMMMWFTVLILKFSLNDLSMTVS